MTEILSNRNKIHFHESFPTLAFSLHQQMSRKTAIRIWTGICDSDGGSLPRELKANRRNHNGNV
jgi:hypothetical protein